MSGRTRGLAAFAIVAMLIGSGLDADAKPKKKLPTRNLACDATLGPGTKSFRLGNNLDCTTPGLLIQGVSDLVVDLGGHRLQGDGGDNGLRVFGADRVTIRNGVLDNFDFNVIVGNSNRVTLQNLVVTQSNNRVAIQDGVGHKVIGNTLIDVDLSIEDQGGSPDPSGIVVSKNTVVGGGIATVGPAGIDGSTFSSNRVFGSPGTGILITDQSERNKVTSNTVIGAADFGIHVNGDGADGNVVRGNTVRGQTAVDGTGINVVDGDRTAISENRTTANRFGITVSGLAEDTVISDNNASANLDTGVLYDGADSGEIASNTVNENGAVGIDVPFGVAALVKGNTANFTGYLNGLNDAAGIGIRAPSATGGNNRVQGSDGTDCTSSDPDLCVIGPPTPPPLIQCDVQVTAAATLHHPMVCGTVAAVDINGNGFTVDLGEHLIDAGDSDPEDGALHLSPATHDVTVLGGLMTGSSNGVNFLSPGAGAAHDVRISGAVIVGNTDNGVRIQGQDVVPQGDTVTAGRNRIESSTILGTLLTVGVRVEEAPTNSFVGNTIVGNSLGLELARSVANSVTGNTVIGGNNGVTLTNVAGDELPASNTLASNQLVALSNRGIDLQDAVANTIRSNRIVGAGSVGIRGINGGFLGGVQDNLLERNIVTGGGGDGISLGADDRHNDLIGNVTSANHGRGIVLGSAADGNTLRENRADENGADSAGDAGIVVADPVGLGDPDVLVRNSASRNGFLSETTGDDIGLGIRAGTDTTSKANVARANDDPDQCFQLSCS